MPARALAKCSKSIVHRRSGNQAKRVAGFTLGFGGNSLGIPIDLFTPLFAVSRMSGWTAHVLEQYHNNRLIRPRAEYKGKPDGQPWIPLEKR